MHRLRLFGILTALAIFVAACGGPTPPPDGDTFALTVNTAGDGAGSVSATVDGEAVADLSAIAEGAEVTLVATPDEDSVFVGWGGDCTGTDTTCVLTMDADKTVTATFDAEDDEPLPAEVPLNVTIGGSAAGTVTQPELGINCAYDPVGGQSGECEAAAASTTTEYTFTATPADGMEFGGWGDGAAACGTELTCAVTPSANPFVVSATFNDPTEPEPTSGSVAIANTEDDGFEWRADASAATTNAADVEGNTYNSLRNIGLAYLQRYGVEVTSGFAFRDLDIPAGAEITEAYIQFHSIVRSVGSGPAGSYNPTDSNEVVVTIAAEDSLAPAPIPERDEAPFENNLTGRALVGDTVDWNIPDWPNRAEATEAQRTPNLAALLQALVDKAEWTQGDSDVMFIISNSDDSPATGWRQVADYSESQDASAGAYAAVLHFSYQLP